MVLSPTLLRLLAEIANIRSTDFLARPLQTLADAAQPHLRKRPRPDRTGEEEG